jgi:hypothetical protein
VIAGSVNIDGKIDCLPKVNAREIVVDSEVGRDAELNADQIEPAPLAKFRGALRYSGPIEIDKIHGVAIGGSITTKIEFFAFALLLLILLGALPFVGFLVILAVATVGTGACVLALYRHRQAGRTPPSAGTATSGQSVAINPVSG